MKELFCNALRHAFKGRSSGSMLVSLREDAGEVRLSVSDDGVGLPREMNWEESRSLGLRIVKMPTGQLQHTLTVASENGIRFALQFKRPAEEE